MIKSFSAVVLLFAVTFAFAAEKPTPPDDLELRVKVALALATPSKDCGACVFDEPEARAKAALMNRPLALIVGDCHGRQVAVNAGAVACIVKDYDGKTAPRVVILSPKPDGWNLWPELPADATPETIRKAVADATPQPPKKMEEPAAPVAVKQYKKVCINGVCYEVEIK